MSHSPFTYSRRRFLKLGMGAAAAAFTGPSLLRSPWAQAASALEHSRLSPIQPVSWDDPASHDFNGDDPDGPHRIFWDKWNFLASKGGIPAPSERVPFVIVGGGMAGLLCAWTLRGQNPLLLEQSEQLGGNSKGESRGDLRFSIGAAYLSEPDEGDETDTLLKDLGIRDAFRREDSSESLTLRNGRFSRDLWSERPDILQTLLEIGENEYPEIPFAEGEGLLDRKRWLEWDRLSFDAWLERFGPIPDAIHEFITLYCWSSFGTGPDELSATQALNFLSADLGGTIAAPGGNAIIGEALLGRLLKESVRIRERTLTVDIRVDDAGVNICTLSARGELRTIRAERCVVATPKYVARLLLDQLPTDQADAMAQMKYRAYLVANVLLDRRVASPSYELFRLEGRRPGHPRTETRERPFTDLCFAGWANGDAAETSALTIYKAMPFDGARQFLFADYAHDKYRAQIERGIPEVLRNLGMPENAVKGIRMTRWGHAIPVPERGFLADGTSALVSRPIGNRLAFANQDCFANPCFETAFAAARKAATELAR